MKKTILISLLLTLLIAFVGCQTTKQETPLNQPLVKETIIQEFDIPSLFGKSYSQIIEVLGEPKYESELDALSRSQLDADYDTSGTFEKNKFTLYVESLNNNVTSIFICARAKEDIRDGVRDFEDFLIAGNIVTNSEDYSLKGSKAMIDPTKYTCVTLTEK